MAGIIFDVAVRMVCDMLKPAKDAYLKEDAGSDAGRGQLSQRMSRAQRNIDALCNPVTNPPMAPRIAKTDTMIANIF